MNLSGVVLEFLVIGMVAAAGLGLGLHGLEVSLGPVDFGDLPTAAVNGIVGLLLLYSLGTERGSPFFGQLAKVAPISRG